MEQVNEVVVIDAVALERECDSARAELGFTRKCLELASADHKCKQSARTLKAVEQASAQHEEALSTYRTLCNRLFACQH